MGDARPKMEVCPYCKKPFKRLKSHLPHCKMIGPPISADQKVSHSKLAIVSCDKTEKNLTKGVAKGTRKELKTESLTKNVKAENNKSEWAAATSPLPVGILGRLGTAKAGGEATDQNQLSLQALRHAKVKVTLKRVTAPQPPVSDATSPKRELTRDEAESKGSLCRSSETEAASLVSTASLVSSAEPFLSIQDRKYSLAQPRTQPATSANLKLDRVDSQRQKCLEELLDEPTNDGHFPKSSSCGVQQETSVLSRESGSLDGGHLSGVPPYPGNTNTQKSESLLGLHTGPLGNIQAREHQKLGLGIESCQSKGNPEDRMSATQVQEQPCLGRSGMDPISTTKAKPQADLAFPNVFTPPEGALSKLLSVPGSAPQTPPSLAVKSTPEEKAQFCDQSQGPTGTLLFGSERNVLKPTPFRHAHTAQTGHHIASYSAWYPVSKNSLFSCAAADSEAPPRPMGLEWFPELYPGYIELGVLPRGPQPWSPMPQILPLTISQGRSTWKVPWLGRSSAGSKSLEPLALTTSSFPLMSLLGAVHKGLVKCNTTIKKSGVGGLTMLFAGYFTLCYNWSFKHLKLQRWRK